MPGMGDPMDGLSEGERAMVRGVLSGEPVDLKKQTIRAGILRDLLLEARPGWVLPPAGVRLTRGIFEGCLDLEGSTISKPLLVWHSRFQGGGDRGAILVRDARLKRLGIHSSTVEGAIVADRVQVESGVFLGGGLVKGAIQVRGADIVGALGIEGTEFGDGKAAMLAAGLRLTGPLILRRAKAKGEVKLPRALLEAGIYGEDATITGDATGLDAESARIAGDVLLERAQITGTLRFANARIGGRLAAEGLQVAAVPDAVVAEGLNVAQSVDLTGARIGGSIRLDGADIGKAFTADGIEVQGSVAAIAADVIRIGGNWSLARSRLVGVVSLAGADVNGQLVLKDSRLYGTDDALRADGARIRGGCYLSRAVVFGSLRFPAAEIGNQLKLKSATVKVDRGAALFASGARIGRDVDLGGLETIGSVVLDQTRVPGSLDLSASHIVCVALAQATPQAVPARAAAVSPDDDERALSLVDADIVRLRMPERAEERPRGIVDLTRAHVGSFEDYAAAWPPPPKARARSRDGRDIEHLMLDGFTYQHLANPSGAPAAAGRRESRSDRVAERRIAWLAGQPVEAVRDHFEPQAWVQLGERLAAQGFHDDAQRIAVARRRGEARSRSATFGQRVQAGILDVFALYGFNPWRTVIWMALFIALFGAVFSTAAGFCQRQGCLDESVFVVSNRDAYTDKDQSFDQHYPEFNALAYSFDVFVPFVAFGYEDHWRPNVNWGPFAEIPLADVSSLLGVRDGRSSDPLAKGATLTLTMGGVLYVLVVLEMLIGLVLTSLAVTGFTGLLRSGD